MTKPTFTGIARELWVSTIGHHSGSFSLSDELSFIVKRTDELVFLRQKPRELGL